MKAECASIPRDEYEKLMQLARMAPALIAENERLKFENENLKAENRILRDKIDMLVRRVFGSSSEKLDVNQMLLNLWEELNVYVENGELEIDNNLIENMIRVPALGKKTGCSSVPRMRA